MLEPYSKRNNGKREEGTSIYVFLGFLSWTNIILSLDFTNPMIKDFGFYKSREITFLLDPLRDRPLRGSFKSLILDTLIILSSSLR